MIAFAQFVYLIYPSVPVLGEPMQQEDKLTLAPADVMDIYVVYLCVIVFDDIFWMNYRSIIPKIPPVPKQVVKSCWSPSILHLHDIIVTNHVRKISHDRR